GAGGGGVVDGSLWQGQRVLRRDRVVLRHRRGGLRGGGRRVGGGSCGGVGGAGLLGHACSFGSVASAPMLRGAAARSRRSVQRCDVVGLLGAVLVVADDH